MPAIGGPSVTAHPDGRIRKNPELNAELVGSELMVVSRTDLRVHLFNDAATLLWQALDHFDNAAALEDLLAEAWPHKPRPEIQLTVRDFLARLIECGLVVASE